MTDVLCSKFFNLDKRFLTERNLKGSLTDRRRVGVICNA